MKRDMDIIRRLLHDTESSDSTIRIDDPLEAHQVAFMLDAGLIKGRLREVDSAGIVGAFIYGLTWNGCEFVDATRDPSLREKAKKHVLKPSASWTFSLLREWLKSEIRPAIFPVP